MSKTKIWNAKKALNIIELAALVLFLRGHKIMAHLINGILVWMKYSSLLLSWREHSVEIVKDFTSEEATMSQVTQGLRLLWTCNSQRRGEAAPADNKATEELPANLQAPASIDPLIKLPGQMYTSKKWHKGTWLRHHPRVHSSVRRHSVSNLHTYPCRREQMLLFLPVAGFMTDGPVTPDKLREKPKMYLI